ncbi:MAG: beta-ketoacyl-ACP synthase II [Oscillospiraceae bacterium]|nr:beta-ketoacyl-ACP synthase II [Oscillospiraceae bacterium]
MRRVVITGMGFKTPIGNDHKTLWESVVSGKHGFKKIEAFNTEDIGVSLAGIVDNFDPAEYIDKKEIRRTDRFCHLALASTADALRDCETDFAGIDPYRAGVIYASGIGGMNTFEQEHIKYLEKGPSRVSVFFIPEMIINMCAGLIAIKTGFKGVNYSVVTACASSNHALGEAFRCIKHGYLDVCLAGGSESTITRFTLAGFNNLTAVSRSSDPDRASIPFDAERNGFVLSEGAGTLVLEELEHAKARGAKIYAEIIGYGSTCDAYHMTAPVNSGEGTAKAMEMCLAESDISRSDVGYINAHGTSTKINDAVETLAIKKVFGQTSAIGQASTIPAVSSTKSMTGHLLGAAGAAEAIITAKALKEGVIPPTAGYKIPDEDCDLDYVTDGARKSDFQIAISNSLGFGGHNAAICLKKY